MNLKTKIQVFHEFFVRLNLLSKLLLRFQRFHALSYFLNLNWL